VSEIVLGLGVAAILAIGCLSQWRPQNDDPQAEWETMAVGRVRTACGIVRQLCCGRRGPYRTDTY
jgi:hypothetical protein